MPDFICKVYRKHSHNGNKTMICYNDYQAKKQVKSRCFQKELKIFTDTGCDYLETFWLSKPEWNLLSTSLFEIVNGTKKINK